MNEPMKAVFKSTGGGGQPPAREATVNFKAGEHIFQEGDLGTEMFIIQEGEIHIAKKLGTEFRVLAKLEKGDFFGEMAIIENAPRSADAFAHTDVRLLSINGSRFDEMLRKNPEIAIRIIRKYSQRLRDANRLLEELARPLVHPEEAPAAALGTVARAREYRLVDVASGSAFYFAEGDVSTIGRADPVTGIRPDIDLTHVDTNRSVSRRHAKIVRHDEGYALLEEVGTLNGTFVNDEKIQTGAPFRIQDGDAVRIGLVQMKVVLE